VIEQALFWVFSVTAIGSAAGVVLNLRNAVSAALNLVVTMLALACLFVLLNAQFIGLIQVMVYAGAIVVLFLFVIMLLNLRGDPMGAESQPVLKTIGALVVGAAMLKLGAVLLALRTPWAEIGPEFGTTRQIGEVMYTDFLLAVQIAGVLLLAGIVAAVVMAKRSLEP
jgi:NADH-quinone oxidoreductase subunit J